MRCKGAVFDLDGVITETAKVHYLAWKAMFDEFLKTKKQREFTRSDYLDYVDGKPRYDGVESFLKSRKLSLPHGDPSDKPDKLTACGLGNRKNVHYQSIIKTEKPRVFESTVKLIKQLKRRGIKVGLASSSKNTKLILRITGLTSLFETIVDGVVSAKMGLNGKPQPDIFVTAAKNMGLSPTHCIVFEDALSGVQAGQNGNFGLVIGVKRGTTDISVADIVVSDLKYISIKDIENWFDVKQRTGIVNKSWEIYYCSYKPDAEMIRETICALGNGYLGSRACHATQKDDSNTHYPGTYLAGIFNKTATPVHGKKIWNNDMVNCPNWALVEFSIGKEKFVDPFKLIIVDYRQKLHLKEAYLEQTLLVKDKNGRMTKLVSRRFACMYDPHYAAIRYEITPLNYNEKITIRSSIDGNVINNNVARYRQLNQRHLKFLSSTKTRGFLNLNVQTSKSKHKISYCAKNTFYQGKTRSRVKPKTVKIKSLIGEEVSFNLKANKTCGVEKIVSIYTSNDVENPKTASQRSIAKVGNYDALFKHHRFSWAVLWNKADFKIVGDLWSQKLIRLHIYHLLGTASPHNVFLDVGMPARGLNGESYRGHIFWDELYIMPFFNTHFPEISKNTL
jgi:beta-phosphoglucomutase family hydrolase